MMAESMVIDRKSCTTHGPPSLSGHKTGSSCRIRKDEIKALDTYRPNIRVVFYTEQIVTLCRVLLNPPKQVLAYNL